MPEQYELTAEFNREFVAFENNNGASRTIIGGVFRITDEGRREGEQLTIKGQADIGELNAGMQYRFLGRDVTHHKYGQQFHFTSFVQSEPLGRRGIISYLKQCPGVGQTTAEYLHQKYGQRAVEKLRNDPAGTAACTPRFPNASAQRASEYLQKQKAIEKCTIELMQMLTGRGFSRGVIKQAIEKWGNRAPRLIKKNPYLLMALRGVGFLKADALYLAEGYPPGVTKRQLLCIQYHLANDQEGHTWYPAEACTGFLREKVSGTTLDAPGAIKLGKRARKLMTKRVNGKLWVGDWRRAYDEQRIADVVIESREEDVKWPMMAGIADISEHQQQELHKATQGTIGILGGSPGTGKSHSIARLIRKLIERRGGPDGIAIVAPTGKAAQRVTEMMRAIELDIRATTIHRLLGVEPGDTGGYDGTGWRFIHNRSNPLPMQYIFCDECSMISVDLMASLLNARPAGCHILFVGDVNQLPPVGHGAPMRDLMHCVPYGELREIRRNSGRIVRACAQIRDTGSFDPSPKVDMAAGENLLLVSKSKPQHQLASLEQFYDRVRAAGRWDPIWDVQVLCFVNDKTPLSRNQLNPRLQEFLNPDGERLDGTDNPYRIGDKVICLRNSHVQDRLLPLEEDTNQHQQSFVANGEIGRVIKLEPRRIVVRMEMPKRELIVPLGMAAQKDDDEGEDKTSWAMAYSITGHKGQGAEWPCVVVMIDDSYAAKMVGCREHIYTSISRAEELTVMIGKRQVVNEMCKRRKIDRRQTFLRELCGRAKKLASQK